MPGSRFGFDDEATVHLGIADHVEKRIDSASSLLAASAAKSLRSLSE